MKTIQIPKNWKYNRLNLSLPKVMGILNLTPDSFFDGGKFNATDNALEQTDKMISEGASIIDIGAVSTRPFAKHITEIEEWQRLKKVLPQIRKKYPATIISVDTYRSNIALKAISEGAEMINDISGGRFDKKIFEVIEAQKVPYVMMHIQGNPQTMQKKPHYVNVTKDVDNFFLLQLEKLMDLGINKNIILDPGFGFGKTVEHNYQLLSGLKTFRKHGFPVLAGISRKSMINKVLGTKPEEALNGTTALNMLALINGAQILRVHDVKEAVETIKLFEIYSKNSSDPTWS